MTEPTQIVAIDGPAGAGKSTTARRVARALDFAFLDTGAMYRAATWWAVDQKVDLDDLAAAAGVVRDMPLDLIEENGMLTVLVAGRDISAAIRSQDVTRLIYKLDQNPAVREHLVGLQRVFGARRPTVAEGRDIGTVVFPEAKCKIFLEATLDERTRRRARELEAKGIGVDLGRLRAEIHERDEKTRTRAIAPLVKADDAVLLNSTDMTIDQVVDEIVGIARSRL